MFIELGNTMTDHLHYIYLFRGRCFCRSDCWWCWCEGSFARGIGNLEGTNKCRDICKQMSRQWRHPDICPDPCPQVPPTVRAAARALTALPRVRMPWGPLTLLPASDVPSHQWYIVYMYWTECPWNPSHLKYALIFRVRTAVFACFVKLLITWIFIFDTSEDMDYLWWLSLAFIPFGRLFRLCHLLCRNIQRIAWFDHYL